MVATMSVSILVRIIPELLRNGRFAGQAEVVDTGETVVFSDAEEVIEFIRLAGAAVSIDGQGALPAAADPDPA
jgi:hypothetical protein